MRLQGRIAVVTGGSGGLGREIVRALVREGALVHAFERSRSHSETVLAGEGSRVLVQEVNVLDERSLAQGFDSVVKAHGKAEILVNTVGGFFGPRMLAEVTPEEWKRIFDLNLTSVYMSCREFLRHTDRTYGRIFNISAMLGLSPRPSMIPYALSKASVALLTELLARELKGTGVTVHAFAPSILLTEANRQSMPDADTSTWVKPESIAEMIVHLCAEDAGAFSGTTIQAYGGV
jgi:NAD(P)-dependent dehydrogenase (short-subunit alcohol dehydrogenase family)